MNTSEENRTPSVYHFKKEYQERFEKGIDTDFKLKGYDACSPINCHKAILCGACSYFKKRFRSSKPPSSEVVDYPHEVVEQAVHFLYYGSCEINKDNSHDLYCLAHHSGCDVLKNELLQTMNSYLSHDNVVDFHESAVTFSDDKVTEKCNAYIRLHFKTMFKQLHGLSKSSLMCILKHDAINILDENIVFRCILEWKRKHPKKNIRDLFLLVRFAYCSKSFLKEAVSVHPVMKNKGLSVELSKAQHYIETGEVYSTMKRKRHWISQSTVNTVHGRSKDFVLINSKKEVCKLTGNAWITVADLPTWYDPYTSICSVPTEEGIACIGSEAGTNAALININTGTTTPLCPLPYAVYALGAVCGGGWLFTTGGGMYDENNVWVHLNPHRLSLGDPSAMWVAMRPLVHDVNWPVVGYMHDKLYVVGGCAGVDHNYVCYPYVQIYDSLSGACKLGSPAPEGCDCVASGGCLYRGMIVVYTKLLCMTYDTYTDTWSSQEHNIPNVQYIHPVVRGNQIYVCVYDGTTRILYDHTHAATDIDVTHLDIPCEFFAV